MGIFMLGLIIVIVINIFLGISFYFNMFKKFNKVMLKIRAWINLDLKEIIDKNYNRTIRLLGIDHFILTILFVGLVIIAFIAYYYKISNKVGYMAFLILSIIIWIYNQIFMQKLKG